MKNIKKIKILYDFNQIGSGIMNITETIDIINVTLNISPDGNCMFGSVLLGLINTNNEVLLSNNPLLFQNSMNSQNDQNDFALQSRIFRNYVKSLLEKLILNDDLFIKYFTASTMSEIYNQLDVENSAEEDITSGNFEYVDGFDFISDTTISARGKRTKTKEYRIKNNKLQEFKNRINNYILNYLGNYSNFGGNFEIAFMAKIFNVNIVIFLQSDNSIQLIESVGSNDFIFVSYSGIHYDSIDLNRDIGIKKIFYKYLKNIKLSNKENEIGEFEFINNLRNYIFGGNISITPEPKENTIVTINQTKENQNGLNIINIYEIIINRILEIASNFRDLTVSTDLISYLYSCIKSLKQDKILEAIDIYQFITKINKFIQIIPEDSVEKAIMNTIREKFQNISGIILVPPDITDLQKKLSKKQIILENNLSF